MITEKRLLRTAFHATLCLTGALGSLQGQTTGNPTEPLRSTATGPVDLRAAVRRVKPAFIRISVEKVMKTRNGEETERVLTSVSGTVLDEQGYVLTVGDAFDGAALISAENERGEIVLCDLVGFDPASNIGVVRIKAIEFAAPEFVTDTDPETGLPVFMLGNPYGLGTTMTAGHVTGTERMIESRGVEWSHLLQLSMAVNPGDQGGPVVDFQGRVVGMILTRYRVPPESLDEVEPQGISFGIPISRALKIAHGIIDQQDVQSRLGKGQHPWVGVRALSLSDDVLISQLRLGKDGGVLIERVFRESPAEKAGIVTNDVVISFDGQAVRGIAHFGELIFAAGPGSTVEVVVIRGGQRQQLRLTIGDRD